MDAIQTASPIRPRPLRDRTTLGTLLLAGSLVVPAAAAFGQASQPNSQQWFVPGQQQQQRPAQGQQQRPAQTQQRPAQAQQRPPAAPREAPAAAAVVGPDGAIPNLPALPKGAPPPPAVVAVIGVPEILNTSTAAMTVRQVIEERRLRLNDEVARRRETWNRMQLELTQQRATMAPEAMRERERRMQDQITEEQRELRDRDAAIQLAGQQALTQIERATVAVIRQVAESRGINLVLHRQAIALNYNEFDITQAVAEQLNKVLPRVEIAPEQVVGQAAPAPAPPAQPQRRTN